MSAVPIRWGLILYSLIMRYLFALILSCFFVVCHAQTLVVCDDDSSITTEYNDGQLWAYRQVKGFVVGLACLEEKDDYGAYYRVQLYIKNLNSYSVIFDPNEVTAYLINKKGEEIHLEVYTNEEFQKKMKRSQNWAMALYGFSAGLNAGSAGYSTSYSTTYGSNGQMYTTTTTHYNPNAVHQANLAANAQIATYSKMMEEDRIVKERGYLKKNTIHPNEGIEGYMNIKRKKGHTLTINIPVDGNLYSFTWDVKKTKK